MYSRLDQLVGIGVSNPDHFEASLLAFMLNPNQVTRSHLFGDPRQQSATLAKVGGYHFLSERMTSLVSALYGNEKGLVFLPVLRIAALAGSTLLLILL